MNGCSYALKRNVGESWEEYDEEISNWIANYKRRPLNKAKS